MRVADVYTRPGVVSVQWITDDVAIVRYHGESGGFGSPFSFSVTMRKDGDVAEFFAGEARAYTRQIARSIHRAMRGIGMRAIHYERRRGRVRENTIPLCNST